jgi:hypothetical protein
MRLTQPKFLPGAHHHRGLGVADEVLHLAGLVGHVQRQIDVAGAQHRQVEHQRFDALFGLRRNAAFGRQVQAVDQVGQHGRATLQVAPGVAQGRRAVGGLDGRWHRDRLGKAARKATQRLWFFM